MRERGRARSGVVFNGEIYNFRELRGELRRAATRFRTARDTEVIAHLYEEHGRRTASSDLRGMFAFALWDAAPQALLLARDRLGQEAAVLRRRAPAAVRLRVGDEGAARRPASARDARPRRARRLPRLPLRARRRARMFEGIRKLPPGHYLLRRRAGDSRSSATGRRTPAPSPTRAVARATRASCASTRSRRSARCMVADVPLGAFLSGGIDSSIVVRAHGRAARPSRSRRSRSAFEGAALGRVRARPRGRRATSAPSTTSASSSPTRSRSCRHWSGTSTSRSPTRRRSRADDARAS